MTKIDLKWIIQSINNKYKIWEMKEYKHNYNLKKKMLLQLKK